MGDNFAIGGAAENVAFAFQALFQGAKVFDHAVVHQRQHLLAAQVRMGIFVRRRTVGGPAGVPDADRAFCRSVGQLLFQQVDPPGRFHQGKFAFGRDGYHAGAVVAAVFQAVQAFDQVVDGLLVPHIANNAAHARNSFVDQAFPRNLLGYSILLPEKMLGRREFAGFGEFDLNYRLICP